LDPFGRTSVLTDGYGCDEDGLDWKRLGLLQFQGSDAPFADKDAAFFPEPVASPSGVESLVFYHRPTLQGLLTDPNEAIAQIKALPIEKREGISIGCVPLDAVRKDINALCTVTETHRLTLPPADWGTIKVGAGAPPVWINEGLLSVIHGVDELEHPQDGSLLRYCAGVIIHDAREIDRRAAREFDIYYGMADYEIGRGSLSLDD
jgi:beta-1,2-mannobiose phosphorylase / 1,2-beta-oligomannan phosphorylase